jgi:hypothetical protein
MEYGTQVWKEHGRVSPDAGGAQAIATGMEDRPMHPGLLALQ